MAFKNCKTPLETFNIQKHTTLACIVIDTNGSVGKYLAMSLCD